MREEQLGGLRARIVGGTDGNGGGSGPVVVLLHGFGAPGTDLVPFGRAFEAPLAGTGTRFVFPEAPIDLGAEYSGGRAWWWIDLMAIQVAKLRGKPLDRTRDEPDGLAEARAKVNALLDDVEAKLTPSALVLGGFSQGAMLSCDVAFRGERKLDALIVMSGTLLAADVWFPRLAGRAGLPVVMTHGSDDPILPMAVAEQLRDAMKSAGLAVTWVPFRGGHEIPPPALNAVAVQLKAVCASAR